MKDEMTENKPRRVVQQMVPDPDRIIEHGQQPTSYERPPKPPQPVNQGGIGNPTQS